MLAAEEFGWAAHEGFPAPAAVYRVGRLAAADMSAALFRAAVRPEALRAARAVLPTSSRFPSRERRERFRMWRGEFRQTA